MCPYFRPTRTINLHLVQLVPAGDSSARLCRHIDPLNGPESSVPALGSWRPPQYNCEAPRGGVWGGGCPPPHRGSAPSPENFLHFHVEMAHFVGILAVNFKFHCMNKTVKIHQNQTDRLLAVIMHEYLHRYFENIKN